MDLAPRKIKVYSLELLEWAPPDAVVDVYCSSGTYVRSLAHDLGNNLGCGANLTGLRRTKSGRFTLRDAVPLRKLRDSFTDGTWYQDLIPAAEALSDWQSIELTNDQVDAIRHGHRIPGTLRWEPWYAGSAKRANWWRCWNLTRLRTNGSPRRCSFPRCQIQPCCRDGIYTMPG